MAIQQRGGGFPVCLQPKLKSNMSILIFVKVIKNSIQSRVIEPRWRARAAAVFSTFFCF